MYIWRGKNRRDKRHLLALGDKEWVPLSEEHHRNDLDETLRCEEEKKFIHYFHDRIQSLIEEYLQTTEHGKKEIEYLQKLQTRQELLYQNIQQLFQQFTLEENPTMINVEGLKNLLKDINLEMNPKQFQKYCEELKISNNFPTVSFDDFYLHFMEHLEKQDNARFSKQASSLVFGFFKQIGSAMAVVASSASPNSTEGRRYQRQQQHQKDRLANRKELTFEEQADLEEKENKKAMNTITRNGSEKLLIDHAIHEAERFARIEFRIAHPPQFRCEQCEQCFPTREECQNHLKDKDYHVNFAKRKIYDEERFDHVNRLLYQGDLGRHLIAYRMIYHSDLATQESRIAAAYYDPYRPSIYDPKGKRRQQLLKGMFVQGYDPSQGIRTSHRNYGLMTQHLAARRIAPHGNTLFQVKHPALQDVIFDLMRCQEDFMDIVSVYDHPKSAALLEQTQVPYCFALLRFEWHGFSITTVKIKGEFTAWQEEEMLCDNVTSRFYYLKELPPGKYRYRFIVDQKERIEEDYSYSRDETSPIGYSNEVFVSSSPLIHVPRAKTVPLSPAVFSSPKHLLAIESKKKQAFASPIQTSPQQQTVSQNTTNNKKILDLTITTTKPKRNVVKVSTIHPTNYDERDDENSVHSQLSDGVEELLGGNTSHPSISSLHAGYKPKLQINTLTDHATTPLGMINHLTGSEKESMIHRLESIELKNLALCDDGAWALAINTKTNSYMIHLDLSYNQISDDGIQALSGALPKLLALKTLKLNGNGFGYDGCRYLAKGLKTSETIQTIELCNNRLGDDGIEEICSNLLRHQDSIQYVYFDCCYIGNDGMECMKEMLLQNRCLLHLSLMSNRFTHIGMYSFFLAMKYNASLLSINFSNNPQIGSLGLKCIGDMLFHNQTIQSLQLNYINMFSGHNLSGLQALCYGIKKNTALLRITLQKNEIEEYHVIDLADALLQNNRILIFDLSLNSVRNERWFQRDEFLKTHLRPSQPSIATILYRNNLLIIRQGKKVAELLRPLSPPTHHEQLVQVEEWKTSKKFGSMKKHSKLLMSHSSSERKNDDEEGENRPFSPYRAPSFPFRSPIHSRSASPDYGQKKDTNMEDEHGNVRVVSDKRKNAILSIAAPAINRAIVNAIAEDAKIGFWTTRRVWRHLPIDNQEKRNQELARITEYERMMAEKSFLKKQMKDYLTAMSLYLDEPPCQQFLLTIAKVFTAYLTELSQLSIGKDNIQKNFLDDKYHDEFLLKSDRNPLEVSFFKNERILQQQQESKGKITMVTESAKQLEKLETAANPLAKTAPAAATSSSTASFFNPLGLFGGNPAALAMKSDYKPRQISINSIMRQQFMNVHISFIQSIFMILSSGSKTIVLHPEKLEVAMNMLTLPCQSMDQLQTILDGTIARSIERVAYHSFVQYTLLHARSLAKQAPARRSKLLWDLYLHPPILEAKSMVLHYLSSQTYRLYREQYRLNLAHTPKFVCHLCQERFSTEKELQKHISKDFYLFNYFTSTSSSASPSNKRGGNGVVGGGSEKEENNRVGSSSEKERSWKEFFAHSTMSTKKRLKKTSIHKRLILEQSIIESHHFVIREVNYYLTGVYFPAYYELLPNHLLPEDYFPQIFDRIGKLGRPMTVLESYRTIRAIDCLGEYLLVTIHGMQGWIRYRNGNRLYLRPIQGFNWDKLHIQETLTYYRVNDNLPKNVEIKVRHRPEMNAEIIGYLHPGEVIQCYAVIDDWLQVKYGKEDAGWVLFRDGKEEVVDQHGRILPSKSLIRQRKIDYSSKPTVVTLTEYDDAVDQSYDDTIITYEINGKVYKNDSFKNPNISSLKIHFFDLIRYGTVKYCTNLHHFLLIPYLLQEKLLAKIRYYKDELNDSNVANQYMESVLQSPFMVTQKELFEIIVQELNDQDILQFFEDIEIIPVVRENTEKSVSRSPSSRLKNAGISYRRKKTAGKLDMSVARETAGAKEGEESPGDETEEEMAIKEQFQNMFGKSMKDDIYGEGANEDEIFDDLDLMSL